MAITISSNSYQNFGSQGGSIITGTGDGSYPTGGYTLTPNQIGLQKINVAIGTTTSGYALAYNYSTGKLMFFTSAGGAGGNTGATSGGTPAGTNAPSTVSAQTFSGGRSAIDLASPVFSGTGLTAVGQVITTTDNQTMSLNECAGMWLISATGATAPNLILSNTAVAAAPAVFTVQGSANTDAGAYSVVGVLPIGTNSTSTADAQVFTGSALGTHTHTVSASGGGFTEVANATDLSAVNFTLQVQGY